MKSAIAPVLSALVLSLGSVLAGGCIAQSGSPEEEAVPTEQAAIGRVHLMPTTQELAKQNTFERTGSHTLTYYGGPVVQNVDVIPVYWNSSVSNQSGITTFYSAVVSGAMMSFLSQYSTSSPAQTIGSGTHGTPYVASQTAKNVTDAQVQTFLINAFNSGALPKPNNNTYYPIHFPAGVTITDGSNSTSCVQFCAYHGTGTYNGQDFYYGVLPDLSQSGCAGGCGGSTVYNNTTSVASHEFAEMITDPAVGLATTYSAPLAWYNRTYGEIGDECNGQQTTAVLGDGKSYTIQKEWSNSANACVTP